MSVAFCSVRSLTLPSRLGLAHLVLNRKGCVQASLFQVYLNGGSGKLLKATEHSTLLPLFFGEFSKELKIIG
jgi:hypothetical protein